MPPRHDVVLPTLTPPTEYYRRIESEFHRLDIAGIDNDRAFEIPLNEIYVRLRVMLDEDAQTDAEHIPGSVPLEIQTALLKYPKLVIAGDPGSGKSTFLLLGGEWARQSDEKLDRYLHQREVGAYLGERQQHLEVVRQEPEACFSPHGARDRSLARPKLPR
jgi:hypothetical protein